jgi:hypothetical protein
MRQLAGNKITDEFLKTLWLQRLPQQTQAILSVSEDKLDKLALMADKIGDSGQNCVSEIQRDKAFELHELKAQISELAEQVKRLSRSRDRSPWRGKTGSPYRKRSQSSRRERKSEKCWYHEKFGDAAKRCRSPCSARVPEN